ncbi:hypothetical protein PHMEG_00015779 [Phytophthora megakarya]|uniref:Uncharacterized protein n=1 Tax=Phytophthora megakarya TaxID=4795 RepID=A0A225W1Y2_9STRA|nr:hypothetical protein PHMEG_00015779 [Phytophthora megakarya]
MLRDLGIQQRKEATLHCDNQSTINEVEHNGNLPDKQPQYGRPESTFQGNLIHTFVDTL